jgi:hypothetical protein
VGTDAHLIIDGLLVAGFGLQHSILATLRSKRLVKKITGMEALAWRSVESLCNVVYILAAASLWYHSSDVVWRFTGATRIVVVAVVVLSWLWYWELHLYEYDCGLAFGSTTLVAPLAGAKGPKLISWKVGSRRWIRFPVHTAFFGMFFFMPTMTSDLLVLAITLNIYNVIGSVLYDKRLVTLGGAGYRAYVAVTGLIWPPVYRAPRGAQALEMPVPQHWRRPVKHLPGLAAGIVLGGFYAALIGLAVPEPMYMLRVGLVGLAGAVLVGIVLGRLLRPFAPDWAQQQTDLSTTVALAAATGVVSWVCIEWVRAGSVPTFAAFLPLWFIVQYLGHVFAFLSDRGKWRASLTADELAAVLAHVEAAAAAVTTPPGDEVPAGSSPATVAVSTHDV